MKILKVLKNLRSGLIPIVLLALYLFSERLISQAAAEPPQPTNLTVFHRSGQTFITWTERADLSGERYRVYRHEQPITAATLGTATLLYEVSEGSSSFFANRYISPEGTWSPRYVERFVIDDSGNGPQLDAGTGLLVWMLVSEDFGGGSNGSGYYAVTTVESGMENRSDFDSQNASVGVAESVADPQPVELPNNVGDGGHVYIQYMDLRNWNPTFHAPNPTNQYYGLAPNSSEVANAIQYAYDYVVYEPTAESCSGTTPDELPVIVNLHGWGGSSHSGCLGLDGRGRSPVCGCLLCHQNWRDDTDTHHDGHTDLHADTHQHSDKWCANGGDLYAHDCPLNCRRNSTLPLPSVVK